MKPGNRLKRWCFFLVTVCLIACLAGCDALHEYTLTGHMWDNGLADNQHEAATDPNLRLSRTKDGRDVLVEYTETNESATRLTRRAFLLYPNDWRINARKRPQFINASKADKLRASPIEIFSRTNAPPAAPPAEYALLSANNDGFTIIIDSFETGFHALPVYLGVRGRIVRVCLTPASLSCDIVAWTAITASIVGIIWASSYASSAR